MGLFASRPSSRGRSRSSSSSGGGIGLKALSGVVEETGTGADFNEVSRRIKEAMKERRKHRRRKTGDEGEEEE